MTNEDAIKIATGLRTSYKDESDLMVDFCNTIIRALEKEPALDKIKAEMELHRRKTASIDPYDLVGDCLDIIDRYSESENQENKDTKKKEGIEL